MLAAEPKALAKQAAKEKSPYPIRRKYLMSTAIIILCTFLFFVVVCTKHFLLAFYIIHSYLNFIPLKMATSMGTFGIAFVPAFCPNLNFFFFFFAKIECGLYFLDRFDMLMSKMIFKK